MSNDPNTGDPDTTPSGAASGATPDFHNMVQQAQQYMAEARSAMETAMQHTQSALQSAKTHVSDAINESEHMESEALQTVNKGEDALKNAVQQANEAVANAGKNAQAAMQHATQMVQNAVTGVTHQDASQGTPPAASAGDPQHPPSGRSAPTHLSGPEGS